MKADGNKAKSPSFASTEFHAMGRVEQVGEKKVVRFPLPTHFQGHTFAVDFLHADDELVYCGPFRIEYVLCSEFVIFLYDLSLVDLEGGFSNLRVVGRVAKAKEITLQYTWPDRNAELREAQVTLKTHDTILQRLVLTLPDQELADAITIGGQLISRILDSICFRKQIPLQIRHIDIYQAEAGHLLRRYLTVPYSELVLEEEDILTSQNIPKSLGPVLRLFREAINSAKPHYRLLCLYRIREGIQKIQAENNNKLKDLGVEFTRPSRRIPDTELTRKYFPDLIGKKLGAFLNHVQKHYRLAIAHLNFNEYERMLLDPADVRTDHRIDYTNAVLISMMHQMIEDEWALMNTWGLT